jgi:hypothetical protein
MVFITAICSSDMLSHTSLPGVAIERVLRETQKVLKSSGKAHSRQSNARWLARYTAKHDDPEQAD